MTTPYQTDAPSSTITSPTSVAVGATNAVGWIRGLRPSNDNSGISRYLRTARSQVRPRDAQRVGRRRPLGAERRRGREREAMHEHTAVLARRAGDAVGRAGRPGA